MLEVIEFLSEPIGLIGLDNIRDLIKYEIPESERIEYKRELSRKRNGDPDNWMTGDNTIGDRAKRNLIKEVVAMANTRGGTIILGIDQSQDNPPVAREITPVPRCADLADRLTSVLISSIEPLIPQVEVIPVIKDNEDGVVVIRVGKSRQAPHRSKPNLKCYVRRNDQCRELTMREIQDLTLNLSRGFEQVERKFSERSERFGDEIRSIFKPELAFGVRVTALPLDDTIQIDRVFYRGEIVETLKVPWERIFLTRDDDGPIELEPCSNLETIYWRPMLRSARADSGSFYVNWGNASDAPDNRRPTNNSYREIHSNGLVELGFVSRAYPEDVRANFLSPNTPLALLANLIKQVDQVRKQAGTPYVEYAIEVQILTVRTPITIGEPKPEYRHAIGTIKPGSLLFPRYPLGEMSDAPQILRLFRRDLYNALGKDIHDENTWITIN